VVGRLAKVIRAQSLWYHHPLTRRGGKDRPADGSHPVFPAIAVFLVVDEIVTEAID
jgi:hypothetical protein